MKSVKIFWNNIPFGFGLVHIEDFSALQKGIPIQILGTGWFTYDYSFFPDQEVNPDDEQDPFSLITIKGDFVQNVAKNAIQVTLLDEQD